MLENPLLNDLSVELGALEYIEMYSFVMRVYGVVMSNVKNALHH